MRPLDVAARRILAWSARHAEPSRGPWIDALRAELELVPVGPARLVWALGGLSIVCSSRRTTLTRIWRALPGWLRVSAFGLALGLAMTLVIVWSNVIVPDHESDDEYTAWYLAFYVALLVYFGLSGFLAARGGSSHAVATLTGALTAVLSVGIILATFVVIDNLFLSIVMTQPDKANGYAAYAYAHSGIASQRDYVNQGLGAAFVILPFVGAVGAGLGLAGGLLATWLRQGPAHAV